MVTLPAVTKAMGSKIHLHGADLLAFLRSFEGAAASFSSEAEEWSLWLPELGADEHPLTPASQIFFPVILRHASGSAFAIRFFYDCSTGKVRYYTSAIPETVATRPEFANAVSELFRHSLPVEPVRQRVIGRAGSRRAEVELAPARPRVASAEPAEITKPAPRPILALETAPAKVPASPVPTPIEPRGEPMPPRMANPGTGGVRLEIGPRMRSVLLTLIVVVGLLGVAAMGLYAYLRVNEDPGVAHHRLQLEAMRLREGR